MNDDSNRETFEPIADAIERIAHKAVAERIPISDSSGHRIDREMWLTLRRQDITASDVPAVCGEGMFGSAAKVWAEKRGLLLPQEMTEPMKRGIWGEAAVFEALAWERPTWDIRRAKVYLRDVAARLGATPDGAAIDPERPGIGMVQTKVIGERVFENDWLDNPSDNPHDPFASATPPLAYRLQTLTEAMLGAADWAVLVVLIVGQWKWSLRIFDVERHAAAETMIRGKVAAFWRDYLDTGIQPPIDPERDSELVKQLYARDDGTEIDLSSDNRMPELVDELATIKATIKGAETLKTAIETDIKAKMGEHTFGRLVDGRMITWKIQHRDGYTVNPTSFRVLRVLKGRAA